MRSALRLLFTLALLTPLTMANAQSPAALVPADIDRIVGPGWSGTLTYRDYGNDARTTIKAAPLVRRLPDATDGSARWDFRIAYADEPHANSGDTLVLSPDGLRFRNADVTARELLADGRVQVTTEQDGQDNERSARIRLVYILGERSASLQKLVRYEGGEFFERHIYVWTR